MRKIQRFRGDRRLKGLGEYRDPPFKGRVRWPDHGGGGGWGRYSGLWLGAVFAGLIIGTQTNWLDTEAVQITVAPQPRGEQRAEPGRPSALADPDEAYPTGSVSPGVVPAAGRVRFGLCHVGGGTNCVVDGDTIWFGGQKIRIATIDAPETHDPKCADELDLGNRATRRLHQLVNSGEVTLAPIDRDEDRYGRKLRIVKVDGVSVGDTLVADGLARPYAGGRRPWC